MNYSSANPWQLFAEQHIDNPRAANAGFHQHHSGMIADDFSDDLSVTSEGCSRIFSKDRRYGFGRYDGQQFALVGRIEGIES